MNCQHHSQDRNGPSGEPLQAIGLIGKYHSRETVEALRELIPYLRSRGVTVCVEAETAEHLTAVSGEKSTDWQAASYAEIGARADVAIVVGGDGTMLGAARKLARHGVSLVGVNQGRLGFMTDIAHDEMLARMEDLLAGRFVPENRLMLDAEIVRDGKESTCHAR